MEFIIELIGAIIIAIRDIVYGNKNPDERITVKNTILGFLVTILFFSLFFERNSIKKCTSKFMNLGYFSE